HGHLSMVNPLGWTYLTFPLSENNGIPLLIALIFIAILVVIAFMLEEARDMGESYIAQRKGRRHASTSLLSIQGLLLRLNRGTIISWLIAFLILGATYGSIYGDMQDFLSSNDFMKQMFTH